MRETEPIPMDPSIKPSWTPFQLQKLFQLPAAPEPQQSMKNALVTYSRLLRVFRKDYTNDGCLAWITGPKKWKRLRR